MEPNLHRIISTYIPNCASVALEKFHQILYYIKIFGTFPGPYIEFENVRKMPGETLFTEQYLHWQIFKYFGATELRALSLVNKKMRAIVAHWLAGSICHEVSFEYDKYHLRDSIVMLKYGDWQLQIYNIVDLVLCINDNVDNNVNNNVNNNVDISTNIAINIAIKIVNNNLATFSYIGKIPSLCILIAENIFDISGEISFDLCPNCKGLKRVKNWKTRESILIYRSGCCDCTNPRFISVVFYEKIIRENLPPIRYYIHLSKNKIPQFCASKIKHWGESLYNVIFDVLMADSRLSD